MKYLTSNQVIERYQISQMSLWRWGKDEALNFPKPMIIKRRKYWLEDDLVKWDAREGQETTSNVPKHKDPEWIKTRSEVLDHVAQKGEPMTTVEDECDEYVEGHLSDADIRAATKQIFTLISFATEATAEDAVKYSEAALNAANAMLSVTAYAKRETSAAPRPPSIPSRKSKDGAKK